MVDAGLLLDEESLSGPPSASRMSEDELDELSVEEFGLSLEEVCWERSELCELFGDEDDDDDCDDCCCSVSSLSFFARARFALAASSPGLICKARS